MSTRGTAVTPSDDEPRLGSSATRAPGRPSAPATSAALPDVDALGTYLLPARPMSAKLVLPPVPAGPGPRAPTPESSASPVAVSRGPDGAAMCSGKGSWPEGACYTPGAPAAD